MNEQWIDELRSHPVNTDPRPGFKDELRAKLIAEHNGTTTPNTTHVDTYRRWRLLGAAAACVALLIGALVLLTGNDQALTPTTVPETTLDTTATSGPVQPSAFEALDEARTRWADAAVLSYRMTVAEDRNSWSQGCAWITVVSGGVVTESSIDPSSTSQECPQAEWTVEQLHDLISTWLGSIEEFESAEFGEHTFQVVYNEIGVPVTMEYDLANSDDEESSLRVTFASLQPNTATEGSEMSVDGALIVGAEFEVSFTGRLRESRGGFFWLQEPDGTQVALLRSDGNPDVPMGYDLDVATASMVDDALGGDSSMLVLPPQIAPGPYVLCTANSAPPDVCIDVELLAG